MVPYRQLYRIVPSQEMGSQVFRGGIIGAYSFLDRGVPYIATQYIALKFKATDAYSQITPVEDRPFECGKTKRLLLFFPGGIGDIIALNPCLKRFRETYPNVEVGVVSSMADKCLLEPWFDSMWDYPIREEVANHYDAWLNIAEIDRLNVSRELTDVFSEYLNIDKPNEHAELIPDKCLKEALEGFIVNDRIRVGAQFHSADHYRSYPGYMAVFSMIGLAKYGYECYILGTPEHRFSFVDNRNKATSPPDHIQDMSGVLTSTEMFIAFMDLMDVIVTVDTAALHIGGVLEKPTLGLFGLTQGEVRTSYYPTVDYIQGEAECAPCLSVRDVPPCENPWCKAMLDIKSIDVAKRTVEVYEKWTTKTEETKKTRTQS